MSDLTDIANQKRPLSYVSWLQLYKKNAVSEQIALTEYNQYVHNWHTTQDEKAAAEVTTVADLYRNLFKEITLHFTTEEERRFLSNIDLNSKKDLDIAIPFFVKKLKQISQYFVAKREEAKQAKVKYNFNGSSLGLEKQIQFTIFNLISNQDFISQFEITTSIPSLSTVIAEMAVAVDGLYDTTTTYFDQASGNNDIDPLPVLDLQEAIVELLGSIPIALSTDPEDQIILTADNEEILANVSRTDLQDLPYSEFLNAIKRLENLSIGFHERLLEKYMGTQFYYVSTGSTLNDIVSGVLFSPTNDHANVLNRYKPTQVTVPDDANLKTIQEIGSYFTPGKLGLLCFTGFTQDFQVDTTLLSANTIFIFPDPHIYGSGRGNTHTDQRSPIKHRENVTVIKADNSTGMLVGDIVDVQYHQKHYPYQSREETLKYQPAGVSRSYDQIDFFTGSQKTIWANPDIYPVQPLTSPPFQIRIDDLVITDDIMTEWRSDIFGNEFALYKKVEPKRAFNTVAPTNRYSTKYELADAVNTFSSDDSNLNEAESLNGKYDTFGVIQVRSSHTPMVDTLPNVLSAVFTKYSSDTELMGELLSGVKFFDISNDIILVQTEHYFVMEKYSYSFETGEYKSVTGKKIFLRINPFSYHINFIFDNLITIGADGRAIWDVVTLGPALTGQARWNIRSTPVSSVSSNNIQHQVLWNDHMTIVATSGQAVGPDWSQMTWEIFADDSGDSNQHFLSANMNGANFFGTAANQLTAAVPTSPPFGSSIEAVGTLVYIGPACTSQITFVKTLSGPDAFVEVQVFGNDDTLFDGGGTAGTFTFNLSSGTIANPLTAVVFLNIQPVDYPIDIAPDSVNGYASLSGNVSNTANKRIDWNDHSTLGVTLSTIWTTDSNIVDPIASDWANRVVINGGAMPSNASIRAGSTFIGTLCTNSLLTKFKVINMMAPDSVIAARTPLYINGNVTSDPWGTVGNLDYGVNGVQGTTTSDLAPKYLNTGILPGAVFSSSNAGFTIYLSGGLIIPGDLTEYECGGTNLPYPNPSAEDFRFALQNADGATDIYFFGQSIKSLHLWPLNTADMRGYFHLSRTGATTGSVYFANALSAHSNIAALTGTSGNPTIAVQTTVFADNVTGTRQNFSQRCISFLAYGNGLSQSESLIVHNAVKSLRTSLGGGVFS